MNEMREKIAEIIREFINHGGVWEKEGDILYDDLDELADEILALLPMKEEVKGEKCIYCRGTTYFPEGHPDKLPCKHCNGTGVLHYSDNDNCDRCDGTGKATEEVKSIGAEDRPYNPKVLEDTYDDKPKEWPKKKEIVRHKDHDSLIREYEGYNQALDDCLKVHQSIVAELEEELAWWHNLIQKHHDNKLAPDLKTVWENMEAKAKRYEKGLTDLKYHLGTTLGKGKEMSTAYCIVTKALGGKQA